MPGDEALREETVKSIRTFKGMLINVRVDRVRLADGGETRREVVEHPGAVAILPMLDDGRVILLRQFRQPAKEVLWEIPAGTLHQGEAPEDCARRELTEEIGREPERLEPLAQLYLSPGYSSELMHLFLARGLREAYGKADDDERVRPVTLDFDRVLDMIHSGEIKDAKTVCAVLLAQARR
ncbi:MAG: NUDIX hydrolase [Armatimonadota bacterium]|nr:MAG: NUDIX hydrolase [Armatimonadota bacterium]